MRETQFWHIVVFIWKFRSFLFSRFCKENFRILVEKICSFSGNKIFNFRNLCLCCYNCITLCRVLYPNPNFLLSKNLIATFSNLNFKLFKLFVKFGKIRILSPNLNQKKTLNRIFKWKRQYISGSQFDPDGT